MSQHTRPGFAYRLKHPKECVYCHNKLHWDENFCSLCGEPVFKVCRNCGEPIYSDENFCPYCGTSSLSRYNTEELEKKVVALEAEKEAKKNSRPMMPPFGFPMFFPAIPVVNGAEEVSKLEEVKEEKAPYNGETRYVVAKTEKRARYAADKKFGRGGAGLLFSILALLCVAGAALVAYFVKGIMFGPVAGIAAAGLVLAIIGLCLGIVGCKKKEGRGVAIVAIILSALVILAVVAAIAVVAACWGTKVYSYNPLLKNVQQVWKDTLAAVKGWFKIK